MSELPEGWVNCHLEDCVEIHDSKRKPINNKERQSRISDIDESELYPYYGATGKVGLIDNYLFDGEYVALGEDGVPFFDPLKNKAYMLSGKTWVNNHAHVLKGASGVNNKYLCYFLNQTDYHGFVNGATRLKLTQANMRKLPLLLAPLNEQIRIANKLDSLLAKVDKAQARLEKIPTILKRFRQSVLASATSGELTREWRHGKDHNWPMVELREVGTGFNYGSSSKSKNEGEVPVLRMGNLQGGQLDWNKLVYTSDESEIEKYLLESGDVLFNRTNSPELVGKTSIYRGERKAIYAGYLIRVKGSDRLNSEYLNIQLNSPHARDYCWQVKTDGVSQSNINAKKLQAYEFELPKMDEQSELVRRVGELLSRSDIFEKQYHDARSQLNRLTQSILSKAFKGELVPQDPNDEPASELLQRIQTERELQTSKPKTSPRKKTNKAKQKIKNMKLVDAPDYYLTNLLKKLGNEADADVLWKASELSIDDFYAKLKREMKAETIVDDNNSSDPALRKLRVA